MSNNLNKLFRRILNHYGWYCAITIFSPENPKTQATTHFLKHTGNQFKIEEGRTRMLSIEEAKRSYMQSNNIKTMTEMHTLMKTENLYYVPDILNAK